MELHQNMDQLGCSKLLVTEKRPSINLSKSRIEQMLRMEGEPKITAPRRTAQFIHPDTEEKRQVCAAVAYLPRS